MAIDRRGNTVKSVSAIKLSLPHFLTCTPFFPSHSFFPSLLLSFSPPLYPSLPVSLSFSFFPSLLLSLPPPPYPSLPLSLSHSPSFYLSCCHCLPLRTPLSPVSLSRSPSFYLSFDSKVCETIFSCSSFLDYSLKEVQKILAT